MINKDLFIEKSRISGKGVYTRKEIKKGEKITILKGKEIAYISFILKSLLNKIKMDDPLFINKNKLLILDCLSNSFNHSCEPNAGLRGSNELFALKYIGEYEEITFDYSTNVPNNVFSIFWKMKCNCGSKDCRKNIGNISTIPDSILDFYMNEGAIQYFMMHRMIRK